MRRSAVLGVLLALAAGLAPPRSAAAQDTTAALLRRARDYYEGLDLERALPLLRQVVAPHWSFEITAAQRVEAYTYLAAALVLVGERDSAVSYFAAALTRDPFTDLDPRQFTPAQIAAFAAARPRVFAVAVRPVAATRADVRTERIPFTVTTTHTAALQVLLEPLEAGAPAFPIFQGENQGVREVAWDGLTPGGHVAAPGRYALVAVGRSGLLAGTDSTRVFFQVARDVVVALEDTLPSPRGRVLLPEREPLTHARRELLKGVAVAAAAILVSRVLANKDLGGGQRGGATLIAGAAAATGAAGFVVLSRRRRNIPENVQANLAREVERRAANDAIRRRNADRLAQTILVITPVAGVGP